MRTEFILGLGSNLGDREGYISDAVSKLQSEGFELIKMSDIENTKALIVTDQPDFLNCVVLMRGETDEAGLLKVVKKIEKDMGRVFRFEKGPREIDIDILLMGNSCIHTDKLTIPHPGITERPFVIRQLLQIDPDLKDPRNGMLYREL